MMSELTDLTRQHVMSDLRPYVCTFPDCPQNSETYASQSSFLYHERRVHGGELAYSCTFPECSQAGETYISGPASLSHTRRFHGEDGSFQDNVWWVPYMPCIFCRLVLTHVKSERDRHIGRHMEEIAFTVLPNLMKTGNSTLMHARLEFRAETSLRSHR